MQSSATHVGAAVVLGIAVGWIMARSRDAVAEGPVIMPATTVRTEKLELVDRSGKVRATLGFRYGRDGKEEQPKLVLMDHEHDVCTEIDPNGLSVSTLRGQAKLRLSLYPDAALAIYGAKGAEKGTFRAIEGSAELVVVRPNGDESRFPP